MQRVSEALLWTHLSIYCLLLRYFRGPFMQSFVFQCLRHMCPTHVPRLYEGIIAFTHCSSVTRYITGIPCSTGYQRTENETDEEVTLQKRLACSGQRGENVSARILTYMRAPARLRQGTSWLFRCFHAISLERSRFRKNSTIIISFPCSADHSL